MAGMTKADMVDAEYWRKLMDTYGDQCGGIRSIRFGGGIEYIYDPPITRDSFAVPGDFPGVRSDGGGVYVFGVHPAAIVRPGASGEATEAPQARADPPPEPETGALFGKGRVRLYSDGGRDEFRYTRKPGKDSPFGDTLE